MLPANWPALTPDDVRKIMVPAQRELDARVARAIAWSNTQAPKPTYDQIHSAYPAFVPNDVNRVLAAPLTDAQKKAILMGPVFLADPRILAYAQWAPQQSDDARWKDANYIQFCRDYTGKPVNAGTARCAADLQKANFAVLAGPGVVLRSGTTPGDRSSEPTPQAKSAGWTGVAAAALGALGLVGGGLYYWKTRM
jgi:hypothetical protein